MTPRDLDLLLDLVELKCTGKAVKKLLYTARALNPDIRVSAANKAELIRSALRKAIDTDAIAPQQVYSMVCAAEENGHQHIFYYRPIDQAVADAVNDGEGVASNLFGPNWQVEQDFPKFYLRPKDVVWSDFRIEKTASDKRRWIAKAYAGIESRKFVEERPEGEDRIVRVYKVHISREIYLARWHSLGLLELRVPTQGSKKEVLAANERWWTALAPAFDRAQFTPWDLTTAAKRLVEEQQANIGIYRRGNTRAVDEQGGTALFCPPTPADDLQADATRASAVARYKRFRELVIYWSPQHDNDSIDEEVRTVVAKYTTNEILLSARATAEAVDYITHRLLELSSTGVGSRLTTGVPPRRWVPKLPTNFEDTGATHPRLRPTLEQLRKWVVDHPSATFIEPRRVAVDLIDVSPSTLMATLNVLVEYGVLQRFYSVKAPTTGTLTESLFRSPIEVPAELPDASDTIFKTADADLVQVYAGGGGL